jgi:hypothetical protein
LLNNPAPLSKPSIQNAPLFEAGERQGAESSERHGGAALGNIVKKIFI